MKYSVTKTFKSDGVIYPYGSTIEVSPEAAARASEYLKPAHVHWCQAGLCHCSEKLPGRGYPAGCIRFKCKHYQEQP